MKKKNICAEIMDTSSEMLEKIIKKAHSPEFNKSLS